MTNTTFAIGGDIEVRRLGLGAMRITGPGTWGPPRDRAAALALLRRAADLGVQLIDTADAYGPGVSEELIPEALFPYDGLLIATKGGYERTGPSGESATGDLIGWTPNGRPSHLRSACEASLRRLRLDRIDLVPVDFRPQELFLPRSAEGISDQPVREAGGRQGRDQRHAG